MPHVPSLFGWVDARLSRVSYLPTPSPSDIVSTPHSVRAEVQRGGIRLAPPRREELTRIIDDVIGTVYELGPGVAAARSNRTFYENVLKQNGLWEAAVDIPPNTAPERLRVFRALQATSALSNARCKAIKDLLLANSITKEAGNGFQHNGAGLAVSAVKIGRDASEQPVIRVLTQRTDYYSYRTIAGCSKEILGELGLGPALRIPCGLIDYLDGDFQEFTHLGLGVLIIVHTLVDNRLIIRQRSRRSANYEDGGKFAASANEGLDPHVDVDDEHPYRVRNFTHLVKRALREELFGPASSDPSQLDLIAQIRQCYLTGMCVYTPNLSIDLCFLVRADCTAEEALEAARHARDASFEFQQATALPEFTYQGVEKFLKATITTESANDTWDEGSLVATLLSTLTL
jgi:hypothetical protein